MEAILVFSFLGAAFAFLFDFTTALNNAIKIKWITFIIDFLMTVFASLVTSCVMIAYSNGNFRGWYFFLTVLFFVIYMLTLHRVVFHIWCGILLPFRKIIEKFAKKIKK